jgi:hypothetical protein
MNDKIPVKLTCLCIFLLLLLMSSQDYANIVSLRNDYEQSLAQSTIPPFLFGGQIGNFNRNTCTISESSSCSGFWSCLNLICDYTQKQSYVIVNPNIRSPCNETSEEELSKRLDKNFQKHYNFLKRLDTVSLYLLYFYISCIIFTIIIVANNNYLYCINLFNTLCASSIFVFVINRFTFFFYILDTHQFIYQLAINTDDHPPEFIIKSSSYSRVVLMSVTILELIFVSLVWLILYSLQYKKMLKYRETKLYPIN